MLPDGLDIAATLPRADARDALVLPAAGTPSDLAVARCRMLGANPGDRHEQRAAASPSWFRCCPARRFVPIRGNVDTRLRKLDDGAYDGLVLASAGMRRLGVGDRISAPLPFDLCVPAPGQGIIAVEIRTDDDDARTAWRGCTMRPRRRAVGGTRAGRGPRRRLPAAARRHRRCRCRRALDMQARGRCRPTARRVLRARRHAGRSARSRGARPPACASELARPAPATSWTRRGETQ